MEIQKLKHKEWRRIAKKFRRKKIRQSLARERYQKLEEEENEKLKNPTYQNWLKEQETLDLFRMESEKHQQQVEEENWMRCELLAQKKFREEKKRREAIDAINEAQRLKIQKDFEELQKAAQLKRDKKKQQAEEIEEHNKLLLKKIQDYIEGIIELPSELKKNTDSNPGKDVCQFFVKTAACRYGDQCERNHSRPGLSKIILIRNFFTHIQLTQCRNTEYGSDISLEFSEADVYNDFETFYNDVIPEIKEFGKLINFKVCSNSLAHLRGNVYVEFEKTRDALNAYMKLQGRYYAGKRLNVEFCSLISWKTAICGENYLRKCLKGRNCNFLHVFKNPGNKYNNFYSNLNNPIERQNVDKTIDSWDNIDGDITNERRNWRWSESPERLDNLSNRNQNSTERQRSSNRSLRHHSRSRHSYSKSPSKQKRKISRSRDSDRSSRHSDKISKHSDRSTRSSTSKCSERSSKSKCSGRSSTPKCSERSSTPKCSERSTRSQRKSSRKDHSFTSHESNKKKKKKKHKSRSKSR